MADTIALHDGTILTGVHEDGYCWGEFCCIHKPSDHPLRDAPLSWMGGEIRAMSRVCDHGYSHPDPDDMRFKMGVFDWITVEAIASIHLMRENCDGCCQPQSQVVGNDSGSDRG